jgi:hypothetical protein
MADAVITITIPEAKAQIVKDAFDIVYTGREDTAFDKAEWAKEQVKDFVKSIVHQAKKREGVRTALEDANTEADCLVLY